MSENKKPTEHGRQVKLIQLGYSVAVERIAEWTVNAIRAKGLEDDKIDISEFNELVKELKDRNYEESVRAFLDSSKVSKDN